MSFTETTRLAPSPTGALHLGNARTFLVNYLLARQNGWRVLMRVEDLDGPRVKAEAATQMLDELAWLGLEWEGPVVYQSKRTEHYLAALQQLIDAGWAYPCVCSRKDIEQAASAPHRGEGEIPYPGTCCNKSFAPKGRQDLAGGAASSQAPGKCEQEEEPRRGERKSAQEAAAFRPSGAEDINGPIPGASPPAKSLGPFGAGNSVDSGIVPRAAWRVRAPGIPVEFRDAFSGPQRFDLRDICGDFVIFKNDGTCAYQLAVVVDDAASGVTAIVRGDDLLDSAARQIHLRRLLGLPENVRYWHLPLVVGPDGKRLAKRHGDTRLEHYRKLGATRERVLGLLAYWSGLIDTRREADMNEILAKFDMEKLPHRQAVFTKDDDSFLSGNPHSAIRNNNRQGPG